MIVVRLETQERARMRKRQTYIKCILHSRICAMQHVENPYDRLHTNQKPYLTVVSPRKISLICKRVCETRHALMYPHNFTSSVGGF